MRGAEARGGRGGARAPAVLDTLAAAYAAAGRVDRAARTADAGLRLARSTGRESLAEEIAGRAALYRDGRAFIDVAADHSR